MSARSVEVPEGATEEQLNPQPVVWPECSECYMPYVLRLAWYFGGGREWAWQRDCKHKKAEPRIAVKEAEA